MAVRRVSSHRSHDERCWPVVMLGRMLAPEYEGQEIPSVGGCPLFFFSSAQTHLMKPSVTDLPVPAW